MTRRAIVVGDPFVAEQVSSRAIPEWAVARVDDASGIEPGADAPDAVLVDIASPGAVEAIRTWRTRWPDAFIGGWLAVPRRELWTQAEAAGCDLVANRGAFPNRLAVALVGWTGRRSTRRIRLFHLQDVAGRLGVVQRLTDDHAGAVAVYHVRGRIYATQDVCPHAGRLLSEGELVETLVTCPGHGSQFDVATGERKRGPADTDITTFTVLVENQEVFLEFDV